MVICRAGGTHGGCGVFGGWLGALWGTFGVPRTYNFSWECGRNNWKRQGIPLVPQNTSDFVATPWESRASHTRGSGAAV